MHRRSFLTLAAAVALAPAEVARAAIPVDNILNDPDSPVGGDPKGDVAIVAFLDYNCPFCKKAAPALDKIVADDGHIRLVYKDWPILTKASVDGARLALAAKYQGEYVRAHNVLMALKGRSDAEQMRAAVRGCGLDFARLEADLAAHAADIDALLKRNGAEADSLALPGTPIFLVGPFEVAAALDYDGFKRVVEQTRERQKGG